MNPSFDLSGSQVRQAREYPIEPETVIQSGQAVVLTGGRVAAATAAATVTLGVAAENHLGIPDAFNPRSNGKTIRVYDSPTQIHVSRAPEYAAVSGNTGSFTCAAKSAGLANGFVKLVDKEAGSVNKDPLGAIYDIISSDNTGEITINRGTENGKIDTGDIFEIYPPAGFASGMLNPRLSGLSLDGSTANSALTVMGHVSDLGLVELKLKSIFA
ncbi:MAG: hypothetical protein FWG36_07935 [Oscillospiraceae bacterium]|nr:hypothetical protein [Oscillospiraceae bacterium]